jgi:hypothetical protein
MPCAAEHEPFEELKTSQKSGSASASPRLYGRTLHQHATDRQRFATRIVESRSAARAADSSEFAPRRTGVVVMTR